MDFTTAEGNLDVCGILWGVPKKERQLRKEALIKEFELDSLLKKRFFDLSGREGNSDSPRVHARYGRTFPG